MRPPIFCWTGIVYRQQLLQVNEVLKAADSAIQSGGQMGVGFNDVYQPGSNLPDVGLFSDNNQREEETIPNRRLERTEFSDL